MAHVPTVAAEDSDTTDADEERAFPFGSYPCVQCQALVAKGMLFCLRCTAPQTDDSAKVTKRFFEDQKAANTEQLAEQNRQVAVHSGPMGRMAPFPQLASRPVFGSRVT